MFECSAWAEDSEAAGLVKQDKLSNLGDFHNPNFLSVAAMYTILERSAAKAVGHPQLKEKVAEAKAQAGFQKVAGFGATK